MNKVFLLGARENWICDRFVKEWYDENDWSDVNSKIINTYSISKTMAEKYLWDHVKTLNKKSLEKVESLLKIKTKENVLKKTKPKKNLRPKPFSSLN